MGKSRKRVPISCIWICLLFILLLAVTYTFLGRDPSALQQALNSWGVRTTGGSKILFTMSSTRLNSANQEEIVEENRATISFKDGGQVFVTCPPWNRTSPGKHYTREIPGLQIRSSSNRPLTANMSILLAIVTDASKLELRSLLRMAYSAQTASAANVDVLFVFRKPETDEQRVFVELERRMFNDILTIDSEDSSVAITRGFFAKISQDPRLRHDFVMNLEDDSYVRVSNLAISLADQPREDLYYGYVLPCDNEDAYKMYMAGMGFVLSWDLVEWIGNSSIVTDSKAEGHQDKLVGDWLNEGEKAKNRVNKKPLFYDHPEHGGKCAHEFVPETILIHQITTTRRWADVISFFEPNFSLL